MGGSSIGVPGVLLPLSLYIRPKRSIASGESWKYSYLAKNGVHAFGYNSAESEPILMKSGAL